MSDMLPRRGDEYNVEKGSQLADLSLIAGQISASANAAIETRAIEGWVKNHIDSLIRVLAANEASPAFDSSSNSLIREVLAQELITDEGQAVDDATIESHLQELALMLEEFKNDPGSTDPIFLKLIEDVTFKISEASHQAWGNLQKPETLIGG